MSPPAGRERWCPLSTAASGVTNAPWPRWLRYEGVGARQTGCRWGLESTRRRMNAICQDRSASGVPPPGRALNGSLAEREAGTHSIQVCPRLDGHQTTCAEQRAGRRGALPALEYARRETDRHQSEQFRPMRWTDCCAGGRTPRTGCGRSEACARSAYHWFGSTESSEVLP